MNRAILSLFFDTNRKRDKVLAIDLGAKACKAVLIEKKAEGYALLDYAIIDTPPSDKGFTPELLATQFSKISEAFGGVRCQSVISVSKADSRVTLTEFPVVGVSEMRSALRLSPKSYFQEDLPGYTFDCFALPMAPQPVADKTIPTAPSGDAPPTDPEKMAVRASTPSGPKKIKVLATAAKTQTVSDVRSAAKSAGLLTHYITVSRVGAVSAFAQTGNVGPEEPVAILEIGFKSSTISLMLNRQIVLRRVVHWGADDLIKALATAMNISPAVAEGIATMMPDKIRPKLNQILEPLADEIRATVSYFEVQYDKKLNLLHVCGGTARSPVVLQILETSIFIQCVPWNPAQGLELLFNPERADAFAKEAPQLASAIGSALAWFDEHLIQVNFLSEELEEEALKRPVRLTYAAAAALVLVVAAYVMILQFKVFSAVYQVGKAEDQLASMQKQASVFAASSKEARDVENTIRKLHRRTRDRLLVAPTLSALQYCSIAGVQAVKMHLDKMPFFTPTVPNYTNEVGTVVPGKKGFMNEKAVLTIQSKDFKVPPSSERFIETISTNSFFRTALRKRDSVLLRERLPRQLDPLSPDKSFILFTIECAYEDILTPEE